MKLLLILSLALLALVTRLTNVEAQTTCGSRLRKDWDMMTSTEKTTYKNAIAAAMDSGDYIKFIEMHTEVMSELEAHRQCMFIYWHRYLLVAFENMLRGQGSQYACVTIPYFNWIVAAARVTSGACTSFGNCMAITQETGGFTGTQKTININGIANSGYCSTGSPLNRFCQTSSVSGNACARCVPRSNWNQVTVPSTTGYASVRAQVFNGQNIGQMSPLVEQGCHNNVHANLASTMGTFASPSDPIFWSHHAMVDLLNTIFFKCRVGTARLTFAQKASNPVAWTSCPRRNGGVFNPTDIVTMRTGQYGINPINGTVDPKIGKYFNGVPNQYAGLMDIRDLGSSSYGYYISGQVATMYTQCDASPTSRKLKEEGATNSTSKPTMCGVAEDDGYDADGNDYASKNNFPETDWTGKDDGHKDIVVVSTSGNPVDETTPQEEYYSDDSEKKVVDWYDQTIEAMGGDSHDNMFDLERQACMYEHVCLGGTQDYSDDFKKIWKPKPPRCKTIVEGVLNGTDPIKYESWHKDMLAHFGCPKPTNATYPGSSQGSDGCGSNNSSESGSLATTGVVQESNDTIQFSDLGDSPTDVVSTWDE